MRPSILVVEDNANDEELMLRVFRKADLDSRILIVRDAAAALDLLFSPRGKGAEGHRSSLPRVVFLDLNLPNVSGLDLLRRIRAHETTRLLPVVVLTSSSEQSDLIEGYALGANSYVVKPVSFNRFAQVLCDIGTYWTRLNEPLGP
jgi:two-component system response regulator